MSKFGEIQDQFAVLRRAEIAYWVRLENAMQLIRDGFAAYLGVEPNSRLPGADEPLLWFGVKNVYGKPESDTAHEQNELVFTLNLLISGTRCEFPPSTMAYRLRLKFFADHYMIAEDDVDAIFITITGGDFSPFFARLYETTKQKLSGFTRLG